MGDWFPALVGMLSVFGASVLVSYAVMKYARPRPKAAMPPRESVVRIKNARRDLANAPGLGGRRDLVDSRPLEQRLLRSLLGRRDADSGSVEPRGSDPFQVAGVGEAVGRPYV
ncbi:MAG: hypothetical protein UZ18_ATM001001754 [Armatimonadetes bacterium OLB18]|nr:MAG: hypothetical protein UZ18_ATM001001754 [Armatimonadetes bacterium OLB18]